MAHSSQRGLTLIELLVTVVVIAVLVGAVLPSASAMYQRGRVSAAANDFIMAINVARSEAARRGLVVALRAANAGDANNEWGPGWSVQVDDTDELLQSFPAVRGAVTLDGTNDVDEITFDARGLPNRIVSIDMCSSAGGVRLALTPVGRTSKEALTEEDCT